MEATNESVHIRCGYCGHEFTRSRRFMATVPLGAHVPQHAEIECPEARVIMSVYPFYRDICMKCAGETAMVATRGWYEDTHLPADANGKTKGQPKRSWFYWFSWVVVTATFALLMFLALIGL